MNRTSIRLWRTLLTISTAGIVLLLSVPSLAQLPYLDEPITVDSGGTSGIRVLGAELREQVTGTWGYIKVQNVSKSPARLLIYAEYIEEGGRTCFSAAFSSDTNFGERGPIQPRGTRELWAFNASLDPVVRPTSVRLHIVEVSSPPIADFMELVNAPATLLGGGSSVDTRLQLAPDVLRDSEMPVEIALAKIDVDERGDVQHVVVLNSISKEVEEWFSLYLRSTAVYPQLKRPSRSWPVACLG